MRAFVIAIATVIATCASAGAAERKWYPPERISDTGQVNPQPIMDHEGTALVLFAPAEPPFDVIHGTARAPGGEFAPPVLIDWLHTRAIRFGLTATFDSAGRATLVWPEEDTYGNRKGLRYSTHHPETRHWITRDFFPDAAVPVALAPDGKGTVLAAWAQTDPENPGSCCVGPFVAERRHGGPFGRAQRIGDRTRQFMDLDASRTGAAVLAWADFAEGFKALVRPVSGTFGPPERVPGASVGFSGYMPEASIDDAGEVLFAMRSEEAQGAGQGPLTRIVVVVRRPNGEYLEPRTLATGSGMSAPRIAAGPAGEAVVAWTEGEWENASLRVSVRGPDGEFSPPQTLVESGVRLAEPEIGMDDAGNAIATWAKNRDGRWSVYAAHRPPHGTFQEARRISTTFTSAQGFPAFPYLSVGGPGNALVVWGRAEHDYRQAWVEAAVFDIDPPSVPKFEVKPGTLTFRWTVSEQTSTTITLRRRNRTLRTVNARAVAGGNRKRIRRGKLPAGRYTAILRATDRLGHRSKRRYARFRLSAR